MGWSVVTTDVGGHVACDNPAAAATYAVVAVMVVKPDAVVIDPSGGAVDNNCRSGCDGDACRANDAARQGHHAEEDEREEQKLLAERCHGASFILNKIPVKMTGTT